MSLKSFLIRIKSKAKTNIKLALFLLICSPLILFNCLTASAVESVANPAYSFKNVDLPFPSPSTFGENSCAIIFRSPSITTSNGVSYNEVYEMYVFVFTPEYTDSVHDVVFGITKDSSTNKLTFSAACSANVGTFSIYRLWYYPSILTQYTVSASASKYLDNTSGSAVYTFSPSLYNGSANARDIDVFSLCFFGECGVIYGSGLNQNRQYQYSFMGDISPQLLLNLSSTVSDGFYQQGLKLNNITMWTSEIYNLLKDNYTADDFTTSENTTNSDMNDYENAQSEMLDDNFNKVSDVSLADVSSFKTGSVGNAFAFISSNIEFFSGNSVGANSSMNKIGAVVMVVLGLGLASFVVGLVNRRKE